MMARESVIEHSLTYQGPLQPASQLDECPEHPEVDFPNQWDLGFGYDGGGYGQYRKCRLCKRVFRKVDIRDA